MKYINVKNVFIITLVTLFCSCVYNEDYDEDILINNGVINNNSYNNNAQKDSTNTNSKSNSDTKTGTISFGVDDVQNG